MSSYIFESKAFFFACVELKDVLTFLSSDTPHRHETQICREREEEMMIATAQRYTIRILPACIDWQGNSYPDRFGLTLTLTGNPMRVDGGEYPTREEAIKAGEIACGLRQRCEHDAV